MTVVCLLLHTVQHLLMVKTPVLLCTTTGKGYEKSLRCLENGVIHPFPVVRQRRIGVPNAITIDVLCCCRNSDDGTKMVLCNKCKE